MIGTCCSSTLGNPTTEGSSERPGKADSCVISSVSKATMPEAHWYPFGSLKSPLPSLQTYRWVLTCCNLMALGYAVHRCPLQLDTPGDLTCQAVEPTQSSDRGCPFSQPGRAPLVLSRVFVTRCKNDLEVPSRGSEVR